MTFAEVTSAKYQVDVLRQEIIRSVGKLDNLPEEIRALLIAEADAMSELAQRFSEYQGRTEAREAA